jgi:hypothetical protein
MEALLPDDALVFSTTKDGKLLMLIDTHDELADELRAVLTALAEAVGASVGFVGGRR